MTDNAENDKKNKEKDYSGLCPAVAMYGPTTISDLKEGELKKWCTCGLSKTQPWCDGSHHKTGFHSFKWTVPCNQKIFSICNCKHTKSPPFCDGTHTSLPEIIEQRQSNCPKKVDEHNKNCKLCTNCGWVPEF